jgi:hypothetical protein
MFPFKDSVPRLSGALPGVFALLVMFAASPVQAQYDVYPIQAYSFAQFSSADTASIDLYGEDERLFAILIFLPESDPAQLPPAAKGVDGVLRLYYLRERLSGVIDQLRHESPLVLRFWTGAGGANTHIATMDLEAVGEGE